jgi:cytochrome P450
LIDERRANRAYPEDLLSRLIEHYDLPGEEEAVLHDEVLAFLLSGHDTTSHALCWAFYVLAYQSAHQKLMMDEISKVLGPKTPTADDLKKLKYTRQVAQDCEIPLDDGSNITVPAGAGIMMCHYAVHRREKYWKNPEAFDPDRFSPEQTEQRIPFTWFPFGGGPRICIGFRFAQLESLVALSMVTQRYELSLVPGQKIEPRPIITLRPNRAMLFNIKKRQNLPASSAIPERQTREAECPFHQVA